MSEILNKIKFLLESDMKEAKFIEVGGYPEGFGRTIHVREVTPNKAWEYFGTHVTVENKTVVRDGKQIGTLTKEDGKFRVVPMDNGNFRNGSDVILGDTPVEAIFKFIDYYQHI